jgi:CHAT domain-containing protein
VKIIRFFTATALLLFTCGHHEDTGSGGMWRTVEPRLSVTGKWQPCKHTPLAANRAVFDVQCPAPPPAESGRCDEIVNSRDEADRMLLSRPQCTDQAIAALKRFSQADTVAMNDLAAAYYVRAQRNDNPADLLSAFEFAQKAANAKPTPAGAQFNYALILEALSLNGAAAEAWQRAAATETGEWAAEARRHRAELLQLASIDGEQRWNAVRAALDKALDAHNAAEATRVARQYPAASEKYFEEKVLRRWADSPNAAQLARVVTLAAALSDLFQDQYFNDVAAAITHARSPADVERLRKGHIEFAEALAENPKVTEHYQLAATLLRQGGSPQWLLARIGYIARNVLRTEDYDAELRELDTVAAEGRPYRSVITRVDLNRQFPEYFSSRYTKSFTTYQSVKVAYERVDDWEDEVTAVTQGVTTMADAGLDRAAWREAFVSMRDAPRLANWRTWFKINAAAAYAAVRLQHPEAAVPYLNAMVDSARHQPDSMFLVSALDHRAASEVRLQRYDDAQRDLDEAVKIVDSNPDLHEALEARLAQARGEAAFHRDPGAAVANFSRAIEAAKGEHDTFRAVLYAKRAEAFSRMGKRTDAENDRRRALDLLHGEEEAMLKERKRGDNDDVWNRYFSRFDETYDSLIEQFIDEGRITEAYQYSERARAYEPLDLVRKLPAVPPAFQALAARADAVDIKALCEQLPPGTFLIEYHVFEGRTYAWILSRAGLSGQWLKAQRKDVQRWTETLQEAAVARNSDAFNDGLVAPFDGLLRAPLEAIHHQPGGAAARIVVIPDRRLRGLPFVALRNPDTKRYLIEDHIVSTAGSALLYVFALLRDRALVSNGATALLVGDPAFDPNSVFGQGLLRLHYARQEVAEIAPFYAHAEVLLDAMATPERFFQLAGKNEVIHIAAHGVVNGDAPSQSFLLFNGVLTAEALRSALHTDKTRLVVLGSCSSAGGLPVGTEGIAPLVRPIVGAGVPGVIGALWDIDDATAVSLLVSFHRHYREGKDAAEALRDAQLDMLRSGNPALRSGRFWAAFQAIGYASSPFAKVGDIRKEKPP